MEKMLQVVRGITEKIYRGFLEAGAQAVTLGNHTWDNREIFEFIDERNILLDLLIFLKVLLDKELSI